MLKKLAKGILILIGAIFLILAFFILLSFIMEYFMPEGWLFYEINTIWAYIIAATSLLELAHIAFSKKYRQEYGKKFTIITVVILIISTYIFASSTTIVSDSNFIVRNPINPTGKVYKYSDVEKINAYFTENSLKNNLLDKPGGTFIYEIYLDGKKYEFQTPSVNKNGRYAQADTYSELEDLDRQLVALDVPKVGSTENYELNDLDAIYGQIFLRIVTNK